MSLAPGWTPWKGSNFRSDPQLPGPYRGNGALRLPLHGRCGTHLPPRAGDAPGQVAAYGPVADVYANAEELRQMGLNVPQVTDIFLELRRRGVPCRTDILRLTTA